MGQESCGKGVMERSQVGSDFIVGMLHEEAKSVEQIAKEHLIEVVACTLGHSLSKLTEPFFDPFVEIESACVLNGGMKEGPRFF